MVPKCIGHRNQSILVNQLVNPPIILALLNINGLGKCNPHREEKKQNSVINTFFSSPVYQSNVQIIIDNVPIH